MNAAAFCGRKFRWDGYSIADAYQKVRAIGNRVVPGEALTVVKEDPDDDRILECAQAAGSDFIVSEDKDLLRLGQLRRRSDCDDSGVSRNRRNNL